MDMKALVLGLGAAVLVGLYAGGEVTSLAPSAPDASATQGPAPAAAKRTSGADYARAAWLRYANGAPDDVNGIDWAQLDFAQMQAPKPQPPAAQLPPRAPAAPREATAPPNAYPAPSGDILAGLRSYAPPASLDTAPPEPPPA